MSNIGALLREEIRRLAKREARALTVGLRRDSARLKRTVADHNRRLAALERDNRRLVAEADARLAEGVKVSPEEVAQARIGAARIRALRKRLRLSLAEFGRLLGVNPNTVFVWEAPKSRSPATSFIRLKIRLTPFQFTERRGETGLPAFILLMMS